MNHITTCKDFDFFKPNLVKGFPKDENDQYQFACIYLLQSTSTRFLDVDGYMLYLSQLSN